MKDGRRRPTIRRVVHLAQVSHQTVSRYLRHEGGLRPETVARVERAIAALGYQPQPPRASLTRVVLRETAGPPAQR